MNERLSPAVQAAIDRAAPPSFPGNHQLAIEAFEATHPRGDAHENEKKETSRQAGLQWITPPKDRPWARLFINVLEHEAWRGLSVNVGEFTTH